jgi:hypothetical protein
VQYAVGVDFKLHPDSRHPTRRRLELEGESAKAPVVLRALAFALQDVDQHIALVIDRGGEQFAGLHRDGGVARDDDIHQSAEGLQPEGKRGDIEQQHLLEPARKNLPLDRSAQGDGFIRVLRRV